jgi:hypothetical protein
MDRVIETQVQALPDRTTGGRSGALLAGVIGGSGYHQSAQVG